MSMASRITVCDHSDKKQKRLQIVPSCRPLAQALCLPIVSTVSRITVCNHLDNKRKCLQTVPSCQPLAWALCSPMTTSVSSWNATNCNLHIVSYLTRRISISTAMRHCIVLCVCSRVSWIALSSILNVSFQDLSEMFMAGNCVNVDLIVTFQQTDTSFAPTIHLRRNGGSMN